MEGALRLGMIGFGAIGGAVAAGLAGSGITLAGVLVRDRSLESVRARVTTGIQVVSKLPDLLALHPRVILECAGHEALRAYGADVLRAGKDLVISSVGALADQELHDKLVHAASAGGRLVIPSGALGGLDALGAARRAGLQSVNYVSRKAPAAWKGTKAEELINLATISEPTVFYRGAARQAALDFPKNANVVAAVALAGIGFDRTEVELIADPTSHGNRHVVCAQGPFGQLVADVLARTFPENPKTSMLTPYSILRAMENLSGSVVI